MLLIVLVVIDCGVSTTVNTTILLIYMLSTICVVDCLLKTDQILQLPNARSMILESILKKFHDPKDHYFEKKLYRCLLTFQ